MKTLNKIRASLRIEDEIEIRSEGEAECEVATEEIRKQIMSALTLIRLALSQT